jgi:hypothetical protein
LEGGFFVDFFSSGSHFGEEAVKKIKVATSVADGVGFDRVCDRSKADEEVFSGGGLVEVVLAGLPKIQGKVVEPLVFFLLLREGLGWAIFEGPIVRRMADLTVESVGS